MSLDCPDLQYPIKQCSREMSEPTNGSFVRIKKIVRYLVDRPKIVWRYVWQDEPQSADVYTDSDWGGDRIDRRSSSGGVWMLGKHVIKTWSATQGAVALSSAEAELIALVKCTRECVGVQSMYRDWGSNLTCNVYADSSAALAIGNMKGAGKLRLINGSALWIQDIQDKEGATYMKVLGTANPADLMTQRLTRDKVDSAINA